MMVLRKNQDFFFIQIPLPTQRVTLLVKVLKEKFDLNCSIHTRKNLVNTLLGFKHTDHGR
jgi:hypothetical protein